MLINKVGLLVCGSRTIGNYNPNCNFMNGSPYRYYTNHDHLSLFEQQINRTIESIINIESKENTSFDKENIIIVEGGAIGPDDLASIWARTNNYNYIELPAQWKKFGKSAGYRRNSEMLELSKYVLAFYDGTSKGTAHTIEAAKKKKLKVKTVLISL